ncbi:MAG: nucleophile aminohydrolase [Monoraphidium minutum]|nr:MAG: nucleophile aminohydrolase [Monoraphidium minutum]
MERRCVTTARQCALYALLALACCAGGAAACTQIILGGKGAAYPDQMLSARNMGFFVPANLGFDLVAVPKGTRLAQMPLRAGRALYAPAPTKHAFLCVGASTKQLGAVIATHTNDPAAAAAYGGICTDGLNDAGLSAAWLWDDGSTTGGVDAAPGASDDTTITYLDLTARILGACDTTACARAEAQRLAAVDSPFARGIVSSLIAAGYTTATVHATFCDKAGRCIAVEWPEAGKAAVYDLPQGVFTNNPGVPAQVALYEQYMRDATAAVAAGGPGAPATPLLAWPGGVLHPRPANLTAALAEPAARYIRMAMMMQLYGPVPYSTPANRLSPGHYGDKLAALSQITSIINYSAETGAAPSDGLGGYQWPGQMSQFLSTRDHLAGDYYLRTAFNQNQHRFSVAKLAAGAKVKVADLAALMPAAAYAQDVSF